METATKPLKRNPNLVPLSREHHFGLLFTWKLKQGLAKSIPLFVLRKYALTFWQNQLQPHLEKEEEILQDILPEDDSLQKQFLLEHGLIRELMQQLEANEELSVLLFEALQNLVSEHIRFEERQFFPHLEQRANPEQLQRIGAFLKEEEAEPVEEFVPAFWENGRK